MKQHKKRLHPLVDALFLDVLFNRRTRPIFIYAIIIIGSGKLPPLPDLGADLQAAVDPGVQVKLNVVPSQLLLYPELTSD